MQPPSLSNRGESPDRKRKRNEDQEAEDSESEEERDPIQVNVSESVILEPEEEISESVILEPNAAYYSTNTCKRCVGCGRVIN